MSRRRCTLSTQRDMTLCVDSILSIEGRSNAKISQLFQEHTIKYVTGTLGSHDSCLVWCQYSSLSVNSSLVLLTSTSSRQSAVMVGRTRKVSRLIRRLFGVADKRHTALRLVEPEETISGPVRLLAAIARCTSSLMDYFQDLRTWLIENTNPEALIRVS